MRRWRRREERDDRGNLLARGREMKRRRRGGGVPGVPLTAVWSVVVSSVLNIQYTHAHTHTHIWPLYAG